MGWTINMGDSINVRRFFLSPTSMVPIIHGSIKAASINLDIGWSSSNPYSMDWLLVEVHGSCWHNQPAVLALCMGQEPRCRLIWLVHCSAKPCKEEQKLPIAWWWRVPCFCLIPSLSICDKWYLYRSWIWTILSYVMA